MNGTMKATGETQIQIALGTLLDCAYDKNNLVFETVNTSLRKIAKKHPNEVLRACCIFGRRCEPKPTAEHVGVVLEAMEDICKEHIVYVDGDIIILLLDFCLEIMTQNVAYEPMIQMPACGILVAIGVKHGVQVVDALLTKMSAGVVPHYTIPHTLGSLASANAYGVVPYLKTILGMMLPLLSALKQEPLKQAFAYSLGKFCEAILEYTTNPEQAPDSTIVVQNFHTEMSMAFDVLFAAWLNSKEPKLIETVLYAMAAMFGIIGEEKVRQHTTKSVQVLLSLYRRHKESQAITKCIGSVISVASQTDGTLLEPQLTQILQSLSELICIAPDYAQPELLRSHSEALRCFECLCTHYTDHTLDHVLLLLKHHGEKERSKGLIILTHLTNSTDTAIRSRLKDVLLMLNNMLNENSIKVKRTLMKTIVAFAYKGFLTHPEANTENYLQFIVKLCCRQQILSPTDPHELSDLKQTADNTLYMMSTSVKELDITLWNMLMKCILSADYIDANVILLRCLTHLASRRICKESCEQGFVRCLAMLGKPLEHYRGNFVLNFLKNIRIWETDGYKSVWESRLPGLLKYLEANYDSFNSKEWEDMVFDFLSVLIDAVKDAKFEEGLVRCVKEQLPFYNIRPSDVDVSTKNAEKSFLLKCLAIISCHLTDKDLITDVMDTILQSVKLNDLNELQSCAEAIGIASRSHLKLVIDKLYNIRKDVLLKKNNKFFNFGFMKGQKGEAELEKIRFVLLASYAEICNEAPGDILLPIIQSEILDFVLLELGNCKEYVIRKICLIAVGAIADALHPNRNKLHIQLQDKDKVLQVVSAQIQLHSGPEYIELFPIVIPVLTSLARLPNVPESQQRVRLLKLCFDNVFNASAIYCKLGNDGPGDVKLAQHVFASFSKVNLLVQELLVQSISPATLDEIFTLLEPWLGRKKLEHRLPALEALRTTLQTYLDNMKFAYEGPSTFGQTGIILARVAPRCTDPNKNTRKVAVECVCLILCISSRYEGHMRDHDKIISNSLSNVQEQIDTEDPKLMFNLVTDLAHVICHNVPKYQFGHLVDTLIDGLLDAEPSSSAGAAVLLNTVVTVKGGELQPFVTELIEKMLGVYDKITNKRTQHTALLTVLSFGNHHLKPVINVVLQQPLPYNDAACAFWSILASDGALVVEIIDALKKLLKVGHFYEEEKHIDKLKIATLKPLQALCALQELLRSAETHETCKKQFPEIFSILLIAFASYINTAAPVFANAEKKANSITNRNAYRLLPFLMCKDTFKAFLVNAGTQNAGNVLTLCADSLDSFLDNLPLLVEHVCNDFPQSLSWLVACLGPYIRSEYEPQRIAVTATFAYLLKHIGGVLSVTSGSGDAMLAENVLDMLLDVHQDAGCIVRKFCLRGLGFGAEFLNPELIVRSSQSILGALMQGLDYKNASESVVALESMLSFSKLLKVIETKNLGQTQVTASVRIKPLLQHESAEIREAAFLLFGDLSSSLGPDDAFKEQIHGNLITLLLHLRDVDIQVVKACKCTLRKVGPFIESPKVNILIQDHLLEEANLHFSQFCTDFVKAMSENMQDFFPQFIMTTISFFKSTWTEIRANSALAAGLLYAQATPECRSQVSLDTLSYRLLQLVKDGEPEVRARATEALAYVFTT